MVAPRDDPPGNDDRQNRDRDDVFPVTLPQLQQVIAPQLLVDFAEYFAHTSSKAARVKGSPPYPLGPTEANRAA